MARRKQAIGSFTRPLHLCDTVGKRIVYYREAKGWSQDKLLKVTGMKQSRLSSLERGTRKPSFDEIELISFFVEQSRDSFSMLLRAPAQAQPEPPAELHPAPISRFGLRPRDDQAQGHRPASTDQEAPPPPA